RSSFVAVNAAIPPDAKVLYHRERQTLGIDRDIVRDRPGEQGLIDYGVFRDVRDLYDRFTDAGITHLMFSGREPSLSKQADILLTELTMNWMKPPTTVNSFTIYEMPSVAPPPRHPYRVLSLGLDGYGNGLYRLEHMGVYEVWGRPWVRFPAPM